MAARKSHSKTSFRLASATVNTGNVFHTWSDTYNEGHEEVEEKIYQTVEEAFNGGAPKAFPVAIGNVRLYGEEDGENFKLTVKMGSIEAMTVFGSINGHDKENFDRIYQEAKTELRRAYGDEEDPPAFAFPRMPYSIDVVLPPALLAFPVFFKGFTGGYSVTLAITAMTYLMRRKEAEKSKETA